MTELVIDAIAIVQTTAMKTAIRTAAIDFLRGKRSHCKEIRVQLNIVRWKPMNKSEKRKV